MGSRKRNAHSFRFKSPKLGSLQELVYQLHPVNKINFGEEHGNLLVLLRQEVDPLTVLTLAQFYDPLLRCFIFQDFQMSLNIGRI